VRRLASSSPPSAASALCYTLFATCSQEEIFVDIVEKLTAIFDANGHQKSSSIVGAIQARPAAGG